tara:strand:- start:67 stop:441 length:375 start_codon:yes stop_codon:yes gene_type:complete
MSIKFTRDHEWVKLEDNSATVGITNYAQQQLGDVVFVEVPETGGALEKGSDSGVIESVKAASEIYAPVSGTVTEINSNLSDNPELVNSSPEELGWMYKMSVIDPTELDELMDKVEYDEFVEELG